MDPAAVTGLPPGFVLDPPALPPGFVLDESSAATSGSPDALTNLTKPEYLGPTARSVDPTDMPAAVGQEPYHGLKLAAQSIGRGLLDLGDIARIANPVFGPISLAQDLGIVGGPKIMPSGEDIANRATAAAESVGYEPAKPISFGEKAAQNIIRFGTQGLAGGLGLARAATARAPEMAAEGAKAAFGDTFLAPYLKNPAKAVVGDTAAAGGAGATVTVPQELIPQDVRAKGGGTVGGLADILAMLAGGTTAGGLYSAATGAPVKLLDLARSVRKSGDITLDPETKLATTNKVADKAAKFYQGQAIDPIAAAERIGAEAQAARDAGLPVPTTGLISGDTGLEALERGQRRTLSTPSMFKEPGVSPETKAKYSFGERDKALADQAVTDVGSIKPAGITPEELIAPRSEAERIAQERVTAAEALGKQRVGATEAGGKERVSAAESAARDRVAAAEQPVATARQEAEAAAAAERERAAGVTPMRSETFKTQASERVHGAVTEPYREARTAKNEAFESIDPERTRRVDATDAIEAARRVRQGINELGPTGQQLPGEFVTRLERLAPDIREEATGLTDAAGRPLTREVNRGGDNTAALGDLVDVRKYLSTAYENARQAGNFTLADNIAELRRTINATVEQAPEAAAANVRYREFAETYRPQPTDEGAKFTRDIDRGREPAPSTTAPRFLSGPEKTTALRRMLDASPTRAAGEQAVRDYQLGELASIGLNSNGTLNWRAMAKWRDQNAESLRIFPNQAVDEIIASARRGEKLSADGLARLRDAETKLAETQREAARGVRGAEREAAQGVRAAERLSEQNVRTVERSIDNSAVGTLLGRDPQTAVRDVFASKDPPGAMREIKTELGGNEKATRGWKANVADYFADKVSNVAPHAVSEGDQAIGFAKLVKEFNRHERALAEIYSPEEMLTLRRAHKMLEPLTKKAGQATTGSATAENTELAWRPVELALKAHYGILKGGGVLRTLKIAAKGFGSDDAAQVERLLARAAFDPDLAQHLLTRKIADVGTPAWNAKLQKLIRYGQAARDVTQEGQQ